MMVYPDPSQMDDVAFQEFLRDEKQDVRTLTAILLVQTRTIHQRLRTGDVRFNGIAKTMTEMENKIDLFPCQVECKYETACKEKSADDKREAKEIRKENRDWWGQFKLALVGAVVTLISVALGYFLR